MKNQMDAEDIVQEAFIRYMRKAPDFQDSEHAKAWFLRVTANLCKNSLKTYWNQHTTGLDEAMTKETALTGEDRDVLSAVLALPPKYRPAIHLYCYEGCSTREIARILGKKESTVRSLLSRSLPALVFCLHHFQRLTADEIDVPVASAPVQTAADPAPSGPSPSSSVPGLIPSASEKPGPTKAPGATGHPGGTTRTAPPAKTKAPSGAATQAPAISVRPTEAPITVYFSGECKREPEALFFIPDGLIVL